MSSCQHCGKMHAQDLRFCPETGKVISPERLLPPGTMLEGKYRIGRALGIGGMGAVFEGTHTLLDKRVAIKLLLPEFARDREMIERLMREARTASATGHRNIVAVTDMGFTKDRSLFMVMEYVSGRTLKQVIEAEAPLSIPRACQLIDQVLAALEAVHRRGIVHRDLKPTNIIVFIDDEGQEVLKILDFGISKVSSDLTLSSLTTVGKVMGTPRYMAPEQAVGQSDLDHRADIYGCGAIFYELLTGRPPLVADNYNALIALLLQGEITPPRQVNRSIPEGLSAVVMRALARRPEDRIPDASSLRRALRPHARGLHDATDLGLGGASQPSPTTPAPPSAALAGQPLAPRRSAPGEPDAIERLVETASIPGQTHVVQPASGEIELDSAPDGGHGWERLELDEPRPVQRGAGRAAGQTVYRGSGPRGAALVKWLLVVVVVAAGAGVLWVYRDPILGLVTGTPHVSSTVMLLVETVPPDADVFVDGVLAVTKPVELPRSDRVFSVRVSAGGYTSEVVEVRADRTRSLTVRLLRRP